MHLTTMPFFFISICVTLSNFIHFALPPFPAAAFFGRLADKYRSHKTILLIPILGTTLCMSWFSLAAEKSDNRISLGACSAFLGVFTTAILPVAMDTSVEITYPMPESVTASLLMMSAQFFGIILIFSTSAIHESWGVQVGNWSLTIISLVSLFLMLFFRPEYKRMKAEEKAISGLSVDIH